MQREQVDGIVPEINDCRKFTTATARTRIGIPASGASAFINNRRNKAHLFPTLFRIGVNEELRAPVIIIRCACCLCLPAKNYYRRHGKGIAVISLY